MQHTQIQGEPQSAGSDDSPSFPELQAPHLVLSSPAGIEATTEQSAHIAANAHVAITSGQHTTLAVGRGLFAAVKDRISLFVHQAGMKLIAASGKVEIQAQSDNVEIVAKKVVELLSTQDWVRITGKKGVLINGEGSYIKLTAAGIEHGTTGTWVAHAASHSMVGPRSQGPRTLPMPRKNGKGQLELWNRYFENAEKEGFKGAEYVVTDAAGQTIKGELDAKGHAQVSGLAVGGAKVELGPDPRSPWDEANYYRKVKWPSESDASAGLQPDPAAVALSETMQKAMAQATPLLGAVGQGGQALGQIAGLAGLAGAAGQIAAGAQLGAQLASMSAAGLAQQALQTTGQTSAAQVLDQGLSMAGLPALGGLSPGPMTTPMTTPIAGPISPMSPAGPRPSVLLPPGIAS